MSLINDILNNENQPLSYEDFWDWFKTNDQRYFDVVKSGQNPKVEFFDELSPKLEQLKNGDGYFYLTGMADEETAELVMTPDGIIKNIVFVEELIAAAPKLNNWKFTALKPEVDIEKISLKMADYHFGNDNISFYPIENKDYPDLVDIVIVHNEYNEDEKFTIINGVYIFLDNFLGELNALTTIDHMTVIGKEDAQKELIPIAKLKDYLIWREKEHVEKYNTIRHDPENDMYTTFEAVLNDGKPLVAIINTSILEWDSKVSHPWLLMIEIHFDGAENDGLPDNQTYELMDDFEDEIIDEIQDEYGHLHIGRQTTDNIREIYFACFDFRNPSKITHDISKKYSEKLNITYEIYKDKYWQSFERFIME